jgi:hypothetical protein
VGDDFQGIVAHDLGSALIGRQSVVEGDFFFREALLLASSPCLANVACNFDELLEDFNRTYRIVVVAAYCGLKSL